MKNLIVKYAQKQQHLKVLTRSKTKKKLLSCKNCDFEFFNFDPTKNLESINLILQG